jgi:hypothetical protein
MRVVPWLIAFSIISGSLPQAADGPSIAGGWTLNKELSDAGRDRPDREGDDTGRARGDGRGRGYGGGGRRGGGFGGGFGRGGGGGGAQGEAREDMARTREAMRDIMQPSDHLTITETPGMIVITGADGRTTRLAPDGKKVKDENTKMERKTKWDGARLVSDISGLGPAKMTQIFAVDPESHRLRVSVQMEGGRSGQARTITHVYDADAR